MIETVEVIGGKIFITKNGDEYKPILLCKQTRKELVKQ
jgi:hypothetical protein